MWGFASKAVSRSRRSGSNKSRKTPSSDDEPSLNSSREEGLECPICWESFNVVENVPYVLWCGHTLCKNCIQGLQRAVVRLPTLPVQLPFFITCPWCNLLSFRFVYKGNMRFPSKNYMLLWMVESMNGDRSKSSGNNHQHSVYSSNRNTDMGSHQLSQHRNNRDHRSSQSVQQPILDDPQPGAVYVNAQRLHGSILLFALPSALILYFAFPSLDWLVREIIT
ncbi:hypothetical protein LINGRAHAP2_LOCUS18236 [Linum grandiflorum]